MPLIFFCALYSCIIYDLTTFLTTPVFKHETVFLLGIQSFQRIGIIFIALIDKKRMQTGCWQKKRSRTMLAHPSRMC